MSRRARAVQDATATYLASDLGFLQVFVELPQVDLVHRAGCTGRQYSGDGEHLFAFAVLRPSLGDFGQVLEYDRELLEVCRIQAGEAGAEFLDVRQERLPDRQELRGSDADAMQSEHRVDQIVRLVDYHNMTAETP